MNLLKTELPCFIDFETSSLRPDLYPLEVAWSLPDGSIEDHLISPASIKEWTDWSLESQEIHGIRRRELLEDGKEPAFVCERINRQLAGRLVYSDNSTFDGGCLTKLFRAASVARAPFTLEDVDEALFGRTYPDPTSMALALVQIKELKRRARDRVGGRHRAAVDVRYLIELWKLAKSEVH
jgi:hypothetical protein